MLSKTHSRSDTKSVPALRYLSLGVVAVAAVVAPMFGALVTTNIFVVTVEDRLTEDQYVTSMSAVVEGVIDGDLTIFTGDLTIRGEITGSVQVMSSGTVTVAETGKIGGALRGVAVNTTVSGEVVGDVFVTSASIVVEEPGVLRRDLMGFGGVVRIEGLVERDVRGRSFRTVVTGEVGGDIDVATQRFEVGETATIGGDVLYRSPSDASISPDAEIVGTVTRLPAQSNFVYGLILSLANVVGLLAFLVAGIVVLLIARGTGSRATGAIITNPIRSLLYGIVAVLVTPVVIVLLGATLVGLPLAVFLAMLLVAAIVVGPVPAVAALGNRIMFRRGGLFGAFIVGALLWRLGIWLIPVVGGFLYLIALVWGVGAWITGAIASRRQDEIPLALLPASMVPAGGIPPDWKPPHAPGFGVRPATAAVVVDEPVSASVDTVAPGEQPEDAHPEDLQPEDLRQSVEDGGPHELTVDLAFADTVETEPVSDVSEGGPEPVDEPEPEPEPVEEPEADSGDDWGLPSR